MLGKVLREARENVGLTQEKLALDADVDRTYISQLENDKKSPTIDLLFRICKAIGVRASDVIAKVEDGKKKR